MPIPEKRAGEAKDEFVSRCISSLADEYSTDQAAAICYAQFKKYNMQEEVTPEIDPKELEACMLSLQGQSPSYTGAVAMKICVDRLRVKAKIDAGEAAGVVSPEFEKFAAYPWDECISDMKSQGYGEEAAKRICGAIRAKNL
jgi:hypothetical protein